MASFLSIRESFYGVAKCGELNSYWRRRALGGSSALKSLRIYLIMAVLIALAVAIHDYYSFLLGNDKAVKNVWVIHNGM
jgi:hypothetical protein